MADLKLDSAENTDMHNIQSSNTSATTFEYQVGTEDTDISSGQPETAWSNTEWTKWLKYYKTFPEVSAIIDKIALWSVGKGYKLKGGFIRKIQNLMKMRGIGKDTFNILIYNMLRTSLIAGDSFAEIMRDSSGRLVNIKPLNPGVISIITDEYGMIKRYEQTARVGGEKKTIAKFKPEEMFHLSMNRIADEAHGISTLEKIQDIIEMLKEAKSDQRVVFHRYVKPLMIFSVNEDDPTEVSKFKTKLDQMVELGENMVIPTNTVDKFERFAVPQFATLDPIPWMRYLTKNIIISEGVPEIILGNEDDATEAAAKILYLAFEQMIRFKQLVLEEQIKSQLGIDIKFNFPASIQPSLLEDQKKDGPTNKKMNVNPNKTE